MNIKPSSLSNTMLDTSRINILDNNPDRSTLDTITKPLELSTMPNEAESDALAKKSFLAHTTTPLVNSNDAFNVIDSEVQRIQNDINVTRPDIKSDSWDFTFKSGKFSVHSDVLSNPDKAIIEKKLNDSLALGEAAKKVNASVVAYYQNSPEDNFVGHLDSPSDAGLSYNNVQSQLDKGAIPFKEIMKKTLESMKGIGTEHEQRYSLILFSAKQYLTPSIDTFA